MDIPLNSIDMFSNKVVIITGSTQGIGLTTAELLARKGARLVINSRSPEKVETALRSIKTLTPHVVGLAGDVSNYNFCMELAQLAIATYGRIDILINNAGVASSGQVKDSVPTAFEKVVSINLMGSIYPTMACMTEIQKQKGSILFVASVAGIVGLPSYSAYAATKRAIVSLAESLRIELTDDNVFVGVNYPGFTENDERKTIVKANGEETLLEKRNNVKAVSRERTAGKIIEQLERRKFRMYSSLSAKSVQWMYRLFPQLTLRILKYNRAKINAMN
jgi:3-oxoacyl-[acyl-carrier protein] reductase